MRLGPGILIRTAIALCALLLLVPGSWAKTRRANHSKAKTAATASSKHPSASAKRTKSTGHTSTASAKRGKRSKKPRGQQVIDSDRTREIQAALIRQHYLQGEPTGSWDAQTKAALAKYQQDNGWQTKVVPDSRALIKLGLGPSHEGLLNPESAAISTPHDLGIVPGGASPTHK